MNLEGLSWIGGCVGAVTGIAALFVSVHFTRRATKAAENAALSADKTAEIEAGRRHGELTPQFSVSVAQRNPGSNRAVLTLTLEGPAGLQVLDKVIVHMRGDQPPTANLAGGRTQREMDEATWAPYRLVPNIDGNDQLGRESAAFALRRGERHRLELEPTSAPAWIDSPSWARRYEESAIQLEILCKRKGVEPWTALIEVNQPQAEFDVTGDKKSSGATVLRFTNVGKAAAGGIEFLDNLGGVPRLEGIAVGLVPPGEVTQQVWIADTLGHVTEWVQLSWTDMREARQSFKVRL